MRFQSDRLFVTEWVDDAAPDAAVLLNNFKFLRVKLAGLVQDRIGDPNFADIVQLCGLLDQLNCGLRKSELGGKHR